MKLFLVIDETHFYQPQFVADLIEKTNHEIVGAILVTKVLPKSNLELYLIKHFYYLKLKELFKLGFKKIYFQFKNIFTTNKSEKFYSVKKVYKHYNIDYFEVEYDINQKHYIGQIKAKTPDVIISSNSMIFGDEILNSVKYCINRHSALLPSYRGLWPVFQAVRKNERYVGVSVHTMEKEIDKGQLLAQSVIKIEAKDTIDTLYQKCFSISAETVLNALKNLENNAIVPISNTNLTSYYSFPKKKHWEQFRVNGRKFI